MKNSLKNSSILMKLAVFAIVGMGIARYSNAGNDTITMKVEDQDVEVSKDQFEAFKNVIDPDLKVEWETRGVEGFYLVPFVKKMAFDFIIKHADSFNKKDAKAIKSVFDALLKADDSATFVSVLEAANYLNSQSILTQAAAYINNKNIIRRLIKNKPEFFKALLELQKKYKEVPFFDKSRPLPFAVRFNKPDIVKLLLDVKADPNVVDTYGKTILLRLAEKIKEPNSDIVTYLLDAGADPNIQDEDAYTPLMMAIFRGHNEMVKLLIDAGANLDIARKYKEERRLKSTLETALIIAAFDGQKEGARLLVEAGANLEAKDDDGSTALIVALERGHPDIAELLINAGADPKAKNKMGTAALHYAAKGGYAPIVALLIEKKDDLDKRSALHGRALTLAAANGHKDVVKLLISAGADIALTDDGKTAREWAQEKGHDDIAQLLIKASPEFKREERKKKLGLIGRREKEIKRA